MQKQTVAPAPVVISSVSADQSASGGVVKELYTKAVFPGNLVVLGCGTIGQGIIPMLLKHTDITPDRMTIVAAHDAGREIAERFGVKFILETLTEENYKAVLRKYLSPQDFLLNLSVDVSSEDLIIWCQKHQVLYLDTSDEVWPGFSVDPSLSIDQRTNYIHEDDFLALQRKYAGGPTAIINHGANPGLVSHFIKAALLDIARDIGNGAAALGVPKDRAGWAALMAALKVRVVQISERDTQYSPVPKQADEFVNTWSIDGFLSEAIQPAEFGWGTHEKELPPDGHLHNNGSKGILYLDRPGGLTLVRSWTPREGTFHGFLITHEEAMTTANYYTVKAESGETIFRPTAMYAYHPCDDAVLSLREYAGNNWRMPKKRRIMMEEIERGSDELGVLLMGHKKRAYWYGSDLSIAQARELVPHQNATGMQVTAGALAGIIWALENPNRGVLEPEDLDYKRVLEVAMPYLGIVHGKYTNWTPLRDRKQPLFPEDIASDDPWQFKNFRVM
ncbi:MAG: saccharopine dehydrogenase C-terminal domain-containing protein [Candidatus Adlerbacteria bacterium]|nr:saccharopine dehydrogenase C-terminal domain-containing protein [Candidatus Adlerbacteria bacterium]